MSVTTADSTIEGKAADPSAAATPQRVSDHGWVWQVTALSIALGVMLALAINTTKSISRSKVPWRGFGLNAAILSDYKEKNEELQSQVKELRRSIDELQQGARSTSETTEALKNELQDVRLMAGLSPVEGSGLKITLQDSQEKRLPDLTPEQQDGYLIHDADINGLLSELKAAGAEALAISGADPSNIQRVVVTTTARCVGPNTIVNGMQISAPYRIYAIGNPKELKSALNMPNGYVEQRALNVLKMITIEESQHLVLPKYYGRFSPKYARPTAENP